VDRILYVVNADWYFELHWLDRALKSIKDGYVVCVALPICNPKIKERLELLGIEVVSFKLERTSINPLGEIFSILRMNRIIKEFKPNLIHSVTIKPNLYCALLSKLNGIPLVSTFPGLGTLRVSKSRKIKVIAKIIFSVIRYSSNNKKFLALFENEQDMSFFTSNNYVRARNAVRVYGAGVDTDKFRYVEPNQDHKELRVLFASRLLKNKGLEELVNACESLRLKGVCISLFVAGITDKDSPFSFSKSELDKLTNREVVNWLGKRDDIAELIASSDVVALPTSYGEGIPRILIEACAIGRPIITTELGGCKDICIDSKNGYIVPANNSIKLASALKKISENRNSIKDMGWKGRNIVMERFSNEHIFDQQSRLYHDMINGNNGCQE